MNETDLVLCRCGHFQVAHDDNGCNEIGCPCARFREEAPEELEVILDKPDYRRPVNLAGVGPDAPIIYNDKGAGQSHSPYRFDLLPPLACADVSAILSHGAAKYGEGSYLNIEAKDHLNHAMQHIFAYQAGDTQEGPTIEHAKHAVCRMMFWLECLERQ